MTERELLRRAAELAADHLDTLDTRPVYPRASVDELTARIDVPLPDGPTDPAAVVEELAAALEPGVVASQSGRYFGFVVGCVAARGARRRLARLRVGPEPRAPGARPVGARRRGHGRPMGQGPARDPGDASFAFVTGCQMAHFTASPRRAARARGRRLDVTDDGLSGSPPLRVLVGAKRHSTIDRALRFLGIGRRQSARSMRCRTAASTLRRSARHSPVRTGRRSSARRRAR